MKYLDEYRDEAAVRHFAQAIAGLVTKPWTIMEVCGGQTHSIVKYGIDDLLPRAVTLVHGPGCPVCVTPVELIDKALELAGRPEVIFTSYGDMLRVPGSADDLLRVKARGGDVRIVYSPLDALKIAQANPTRQIVFFAVGFETTAPASAMAAVHARRLRLENFSLLVSHVLVPPAIEAVLTAPLNRVQGFLAPGHVCTVAGNSDYERIARRFHVPMVVTGFEPVDILDGVHRCVKQLEEGRAEIENQYARCVHPEGNAEARRVVDEVFQVVDRKWRGIGELPASGLALNAGYADYDAELRFGIAARRVEESGECMSGQILQGVKKPHECPAFGSRCTPEHPLGATMVSSEGACAAYFRYKRAGTEAPHVRA
ncbi:MAG TPA: hydrogenase formation protein HypD [Planctomycetota bacterium]|nr:hydrogenase formation protein HypD [Planctomycetota bacterium]